MGHRRLGIAIGFVAVLAGSFAATFPFLRSGASAEPKAATPRPASREDCRLAGATKTETTMKPPEERRQVPEKAVRIPLEEPRKPVTCAEATRLGKDCIGQRVTWVGKWIHSESAQYDQTKGSWHIFETRAGPQDRFSSDYPFVAEDPNPLAPRPKGPNPRELRQNPRELARRLQELGQNLKESHKKRWGSTHVVTVTGTISRVVELIFIGRETRYDVPVLTDIKIAIDP
ncbi:MAG TPA: hypothetical protein VG013_31985 [Gemmataceae bacterium]|nr:hypothetical protein [Gemmataceae bacterium]